MELEKLHDFERGVRFGVTQITQCFELLGHYIENDEEVDRYDENLDEIRKNIRKMKSLIFMGSELIRINLNIIRDNVSDMTDSAREVYANLTETHHKFDKDFLFSLTDTHNKNTNDNYVDYISMIRNDILNKMEEMTLVLNDMENIIDNGCIEDIRNIYFTLKPYRESIIKFSDNIINLLENVRETISRNNKFVESMESRKNVIEKL